MRWARRTFSVQTPAASPNGVPLAIATASSSSSKGMTERTRAKYLVLGDKGVRLHVGQDGRREEEAVRQIRRIGADAAVDHLGAVGDGALATMLSSLASWVRVATGPICVAASSGSPILMAAARLASMSSA